MDDFGNGVLVAVIAIVSAVLFTVVGGIINDNSIMNDCDNYGKTSIKSVWYKCERLGEKK